MRNALPPPFPRPTRAQLAAAVSATLKDVIAPGLDVLFCGINPGLYSGATGHHFARPGNRFWPALHAGGFTERVLAPWEKDLLLERGVGITNIVRRTTATAAEVTREELIAGQRRLERKVRGYAPRWLAVAGIGAYRVAFGSPHAVVGPQERTIGSTRIWVLPNPSGLNAHHQPKNLARAFRELREASRAAPSTHPEDTIMPRKKPKTSGPGARTPAGRKAAEGSAAFTLPEAMTGKASPAKAAVGDQPVFAYIASLPQPQRDIAARVDALAARTLPGLERSVKWGMAYYGVGDGWCFSCGGFARHVKLMFINGVALTPVPPVTPIGMGKSTRGVELESVDELDERQVAAWMKQVAAVPGVGGKKR